MLTLSNIIFAGLLLSGISMWIFYFYLAVWRIPREKGNTELLGLYTMGCASVATFCLLLAWRIKEPLARDFVPVFLVLSLVIGYLFRASALSPFKLGEFWRGVAKKNIKEEDKK